MAKLIKIVIISLLFINLFSFESYCQVSASKQREREAARIERDEEQRIAQRHKDNEKRKKQLLRQNKKENDVRSKQVQQQQKKANSYSIERDMKSRKVEKDHSKPSPEERLVMKIEKQKQKEKEKKEKQAEKQYKKDL
ncbi:MAG: hypothetical protein HUK15_08435, partial [Bacteroidales bacterium]|nr:hypothetical protein [Bacteroidales bacterium]